jgi:hypothetical protein
MIKPKTIRWGHVACMGELRNYYKILARKSLKERDH